MGLSKKAEKQLAELRKPIHKSRRKHKRHYKMREMEKRVPQVLYRKENGDYILNRKDYKELRQKLNRQKHWYSGMVKEANGRSNLHHDLKKVAKLYNQIFETEVTNNKLLDVISGQLPLVEVYECICDECQTRFGVRVSDETPNIDWSNCDRLEEAERIDLKGQYERWEYKY